MPRGDYEGDHGMRAPTPLAPLYEWHRASLDPSVKLLAITGEPQCGWYTRRLVKGGPIVPARIWLHQEIDEDGELVGPEILRCEVAGKERDPDEEWMYLADSPITQAEYDFRVADASWCRAHAMDSPEANPTLRVSTRTIPPLF